MPSDNITYHIYSERSILISWIDDIPDLLSVRLEAALRLETYYGDDVVINHGACALLLYWNTRVVMTQELNVIKTLFLNDLKGIGTQTTSWRLPVYYDTATTDFLTVLKHVGCSIEELIAIHLAGNYEVNFIGFLPGFPYLQGLDKRLFIPRKAVPSLQVAAGAVAIANGVCGMYPSGSPGGWHVLGNCPVPLFLPKQDVPNILKAGDRITFYQIDLDVHRALQQTVLNEQFEINTFQHG